MAPIVWEWASFALHWLHVITGIAWIGASFYFVHLDASLGPGAGLPTGVAGEAWQVHGGGFYRMQKYVVAPAELPPRLIWFKWEAYATWISGFLLLCLIYYAGADLYLVDRRVLDLPVWAASVIGLGSLGLGWLAYHGLCKIFLGHRDTWLAISVFGLLVAVAWGFTQVFGGRGAFIQTGALIGSLMVANVFFVIIPNQKIVTADLIAGRDPDPALGKAAKQRSLHNNYLTLPVLFLMISNHYPLSFATAWNWLIIAIVLVVGGVIRHFYNLRHAGRPSPWWTWAVAAAGLAIVVWLSTFPPLAEADGAGEAEGPISFAEVEDIVISRCSMCHAAEPVWAGLAVAPGNLRLESPEGIRRHAPLIEIQAVLSHAMPPGNVTEITSRERRILAAWIAEGARGE